MTRHGPVLSDSTCHFLLLSSPFLWECNLKRFCLSWSSSWIWKRDNEDIPMWLLPLGPSLHWGSSQPQWCQMLMRGVRNQAQAAFQVWGERPSGKGCITHTWRRVSSESVRSWGKEMMEEAYIWKQNDVSGSKVLCINIITIKQKAEGRPQRTNKQMKSWLREVPGSAAGIIVNLHISLKRVFKNIFFERWACQK